MKLNQLIDTLIHGNLYQFNVAKNEQFPAIINAANQELIQLYSRFPVLEKDVAFRRFPEISIYHLTEGIADLMMNPRNYINISWILKIILS